MKILFLSGHYPPATSGGGEISTHLIAQGLAAAGHDLHVVTEGTVPEIENINDVAVMRLPLSFTAKPLLEQRHARRIAKGLKASVDSSQFDIIHAHDFRTIVVLAEWEAISTKTGWPKTVITIRDYAQISGDTNYLLRDGSIPDQPLSWSANLRSNRIAEASLWRKPFRAWQYLFNLPYRYRTFSLFKNQIFISEALRKEIGQHRDLSNINTAVIYNPVAPEYIEKPLREGKPHEVLYVGRVEMYKGVGLLLGAWQNVMQNVRDAHLTLVGRGAQKHQYEQLVDSLRMSRNVTFIDHVPYEKMIDYYDESSIVVSPHLWLEPFGRTVIEGMARGKIVVAADAGGPGEIIEQGQTGFLFARGSHEDLARSLLGALRLEAQRRHSISTTARMWLKQIMSSPARHEKFYNAL